MSDLPDLKCQPCGCDYTGNIAGSWGCREVFPRSVKQRCPWCDSLIESITDDQGNELWTKEGKEDSSMWCTCGGCPNATERVWKDEKAYAELKEKLDASRD